MLKQRLVRYVALNAIVGILIGWALAGAAFALDVADLGKLQGATDVAILAIAMLMFIAGTTFGMIQMGIAVMALGAPEQRSPVGSFLARFAVGRPS